MNTKSKIIALLVVCSLAAMFNNVEAASRNVCSLPLESGLCMAYFKKWGSVNGECEEFIYGGCSGNGNRFDSKEECEEACGR